MAPFDKTTFYFTSTTESSAVLFGWTTIHSEAHLNAGKINDAFLKEWEYVRVLIIDKISFFVCGKNINNLDKILKRLKGAPDDKLFGGVSIIFSGDFHQL